ncbi:GlxA family transcriptional regulator [Leifsonia xyli]|uniref:GlxA family transcriptional regulator n=1 Tax=Leifsonia xyli TaxID=1575 RepID=UPI003D66CDDA
MDTAHPDTHPRPDAEHLVAVLVYDGVKLLDVSGPVDMFAEANRLGANYRVVLVSPDGGPVTTSAGVRLEADYDVGSAPAPATFLVAGSDTHPKTAVPDDLADAAVAISSRAQRTASICTGAFILAAGGMLDGRHATTHWKAAPVLAARYPAIAVDADSIFVTDGSITTSAGVTAGIDLALAFVEEDLGADLARQTARMLVVYLQRPGGQSQFSAALAGPAAPGSTLRTIVQAVTEHPERDHSLGRLAHQLHMSERHVTRLFRDELGTTPARFVLSIRLDLARALLEEGHPAGEAAERAGFPSYEGLRRAFAREFGIAPGAYQRRFRSSRRTSGPETESTPGDVRK